MGNGLIRDVKIEANRRAQSGLGVANMSSMSVTTSNTTQRRVLVGTGAVLCGAGNIYELDSTASHEIDPGHSTNDRYDLVVYDTNAGKSTVIKDYTGSHGVPPKCAPLALVEVPKRASHVLDDHITDVRAVTPYGAIRQLYDYIDNTFDVGDDSDTGGDGDD